MKKRNKYKKKVHTDPGSLVHIGQENIEDDQARLINFNEGEFSMGPIDLKKPINLRSDTTNWISLIGLKDTDNVKFLSQTFNIHRLTQEDILDTTEKAKIEDYEDYLFIVAKALVFNEDNLESEQISFILKDNILISMEEFFPNDFNKIIERLRNGSILRKGSESEVLYALLDSIVDDYFLVIEKIGEKIDLTEDELLNNPSQDILQNIYGLKRDLIYIQNEIWPMRNIVSALSKNQYGFIDDKSIYYFRDVYDHLIQIISLLDTYRDICSGMLDTYLSSLSNKTNDVMKVLTIFSTVSVPLSFLTGLFGMNFVHNPILSWKYGYMFFWFISVISVMIMIYYFKKKKWI